VLVRVIYKLYFTKVRVDGQSGTIQKDGQENKLQIITISRTQKVARILTC